MRQLQYLIKYEYIEKTEGPHPVFACTFSTDSFISFLIHFLLLRHENKVIDIEYRDKVF